MSQRHTDVSVQVSAACPIAVTLDRVAGKWSLGILTAAGPGPVRFSELERAMTGISRRMLTLNLRNLERDGLLTRTVHPTVPPKVEYALTDIGRELLDSLRPLSSWSDRHAPAIAAAQHAYDQAQAQAQTQAQPQTQASA